MTTRPAYTNDPAYALAGFASSLTYEQVPPEVVTMLKRIVLDVTGTTLAGGTLGSGCREFVGVVLGFGGRPDATVFGYGDKLPAPMAALVNGAMAHALNYDDVFPGGGHLGVVTLPVAFALAELLGNVSGRDFLAALAAGGEVTARLQLAVRGADDGTSEAKPQPTQFLGHFAAAATAARLLRLNQDDTMSAFGQALMQASGNRQPVVEGTPAKAVYAAFPNYGGLFSALLAQAGLHSECSVLEGAAGLFQTAYGGRYVASFLTEGLGQRFEMAAAGFKPWPTTGRAHPYIQAALQIAEAQPLNPADITRVVVRGAPFIRTFCEPLAVRRRPSSPVEAEDSIFYGVAKALVNRAVVLADFQPAGLRQADVLDLGGRMEYAIDPSLGAAGVVEVTLTDGSVLERRVSEPLGSAANPLSDQQLLAKFYDGARHAVRPIARERLERFAGLAARLETEDPVELVRVLHP
jgi:2-methylcitrate dehydratase PrpD